jgi:TfoX/Sxy family transcriptional regulator of competence genes
MNKHLCGLKCKFHIVFASIAVTKRGLFVDEGIYFTLAKIADVQIKFMSASMYGKDIIFKVWYIP